MLNLKNYFMRTKLLLFAFLFFGIFGCQDKVELKKETGVVLEKLNSAPKAIVSKEELPEWLYVIVDQWKDPISHKAVYKGKWKERIVYYEYDMHSSCMFCNLFYENGERVSLGNDWEDFQSNSKNWVVIFEFIPNWMLQ